MNENYIVTKSNYFIMNSSYDLSAEEQKIILTLASMVQPEDEEFKPYLFKVDEFIKLLGIENQSWYTEAPKITRELMKKVFEIQEGNKIIQVAWLSSAVYEKGSGYVELEFSPKLKPYMLQLKTMFTQYKLKNILSMRSKYSPRIYEILKANEFKKQGYIEVEVQELRRLLKCEEIYPRHYDFKRFVIETAQRELHKYTDISFDFKEIKTGRRITSIIFYIKNNQEQKIDPNQATLDEAIDDISERIKILENEGIAGPAVIRLSKYSLDRIQRNIEYANKNNPDSTGYLVAAIEQDYAGAVAIAKEKKKAKKNNFEDDKFIGIYRN